MARFRPPGQRRSCPNSRRYNSRYMATLFELLSPVPTLPSVSSGFETPVISERNYRAVNPLAVTTHTGFQTEPRDAVTNRADSDRYSRGLRAECAISRRNQCAAFDRDLEIDSIRLPPLESGYGERRRENKAVSRSSSKSRLSLGSVSVAPCPLIPFSIMIDAAVTPCRGYFAEKKTRIPAARSRLLRNEFEDCCRDIEYFTVHSLIYIYSALVRV